VENFILETTSLVGDEALPVEITNLTQIDNYSNTLVTLKDITFVIPYGSLFNSSHVDAASQSYLTTVRDRYGNTAVIRTMKDFTEKWYGGKTASSYDITALVLPDEGSMMWRLPWLDPADARLTHERFRHTLRVRNYSDLSQTPTPNPFDPIVVWSFNNSDVSEGMWSPLVGDGTFNLLESGGATLNSSRESYFMREFPATTWTAGNNYRGFSKLTELDLSRIPSLPYWKFSTSTHGRTGEIYISFLLGSWGAAPRYWRVVWSTDNESWNVLDDSDFELWNGFSTPSASVRCGRFMFTNQEFFFRLPAAAAGQETLYIKLAGTYNVRVTTATTGSTTSVAGTSSTNIYFVGVYEKR
jgi:hypothetical protein